MRAAASKRGLTVAFAADSHLHADFLSGAYQLGATSGAQVLASAAGDREFTHTGLHDGDEVDLGGLRLRALLTPGHTHEHLAFLLLDGDREVGIFTGGSLIVGSAARTDLISDDRTDELTRAQYASLHRLAALPGDVQVWPTGTVKLVSWLVAAKIGGRDRCIVVVQGPPLPGRDHRPLRVAVSPVPAELS